MTVIIKPRQYQLDGVNKLIRLISEGKRRIVFQLPTGGGKTVCFSYFLQRYFKAYIDHVCKVLVHREELQNQTYKTFKHFNVDNVPVLMVETFFNTLKKGQNLSTQVIIIDECHIGNFRKVMDMFPDAIIIGFTATPISATKKIPLNTMYEAIIVCTQIKELIELNKIDNSTGLVRGMHYSPETALNRDNIGLKSGEYALDQMGIEFSKPKLVECVVEKYIEYGEGKKALVFNTTIEHNELVNAAFVAAGFQSKTIDANPLKITDKDYKSKEEKRREVFKWFAETPGAILNNVGIATTGYDEPSVVNIIANFMTTSITKWHQVCGRGSRPYFDEIEQIWKDHFNIIDLGGNVATLGPWHMPIDWEQEFYHPAKTSKGIAPMKICPNDKVPLILNGKNIFDSDGQQMYRRCGCMIYMSATRCEYCGFLMPRDVVYSDLILKLTLVPDDLIVPRNSPITHQKAVKKIADKINNLPNFERPEKVGMLEQAIIKINDQSDYKQPYSFVVRTSNDPKNIPYDKRPIKTNTT